MFLTRWSSRETKYPGDRDVEHWSNDGRYDKLGCLKVVVNILGEEFSTKVCYDLRNGCQTDTHMYYLYISV